jgi:BirA family biotin operon repressor/biotin-[acetyl-CoA-carboxylase] ligase
MAAVAVQHALEKVCGVVAGIKWPNDLILEEKKLCGILTEGYFEGEEAKMIIGVGVNTNNMVPSQLKDVAISLHDLGITVDNERFVRGVVDEFSG